MHPQHGDPTAHILQFPVEASPVEAFAHHPAEMASRWRLGSSAIMLRISSISWALNFAPAVAHQRQAAAAQRRLRRLRRGAR